MATWAGMTVKQNTQMKKRFRQNPQHVERATAERHCLRVVFLCQLLWAGAHKVSSTSTQAGNSLHRLDVAHRGETVPGRNSRQWMGVQVWRQCFQCVVSVSLEGTNIQRCSSRLRVGPLRYSKGCLWPVWRRCRTPPAGRPGRSDHPGDPAPWPSRGQRWGWDRCSLLPRTGSGRCGYSAPWRTWGRDTDRVVTTMDKSVALLK